MTIKRFSIFLGFVFLVSLAIYLISTPRANEIGLVGIVNGNEVIVSSKIPGRLEKLHVDEGDEVKQGELIAELDRQELEAQVQAQAALIRSLEARLSQVRKTQGWTDDSTSASEKRASATLTAVKAQLEEAKADLWRAETDFKRVATLYGKDVASAQERDRAEAAVRAAQARVASFESQVKAQVAEVAVAEANRKQVGVQQSELESAIAQLDQARATKVEAETRLEYTRIRAPLTGIVSVRVARQGEVVQTSAPLVTILDIDHLWVSAAMEESYADKIHIGDKVKVRLPSGQILEGSVYFRGVDGEFATQRDVSRKKRDIKTFTIKVSVPNPQRQLFAGMTADVLISETSSSWWARLSRKD